MKCHKCNYGNRRDAVYVSFTSALRVDQSVHDAINRVIQAAQDALAAQNKVVQAKAESDQVIAAAQGAGQATLINAKASGRRQPATQRFVDANLGTMAGNSKVEWQYAECHRRGNALYRRDTEETNKQSILIFAQR